MDKKSLSLLVGGALILAVVAATPWVAICGVVFLWFVHGSTSGELSKPAMFRSVAAGGVAGGVVVSSAIVVMQFLVADRAKDSFIHIQWPAREESVISVAMRWTLVTSTGVSMVTALLFAWAVILVVDFLPREKSDPSASS